MAKILTIEDEENLRFSIARRLKQAGHEVAEARTAEDAWHLTRETEFDLILTDMSLEGQDGVELTRRLREEGYEGVVIIMTAYGTVENAVKAMKLGADDYLQKPISLEELAILVERALEQRRVRSRLRLYERMERNRNQGEDLIGESPAWRETLAIAERFAEIPMTTGDRGDQARQLTTILLMGETGVGKGLLARRIHQHAEKPGTEAGADAKESRKGEESAPFVHVNCSALPASLVESELFGHEKGAFTDAKEARPGLFELADGGTIFLDEIGEMPLELQAKLLLVLEEGSFRRVGGSKIRRVRARVIAATNHDLERQVEQGRFRRDLYYRLGAFTIRIPPLRERDDDALLLAETMLERFAKELGRPGARLSDAARSAIRHHDWPGNVRELVNAIQRAVMLCRNDMIEPADMGLSFQASRKASAVEHAPGTAGADGDLKFDFDRGVHTIDEVEKTLIKQALERTGGNVSKAAKLVGMNRSSFRYRIERSGLEEYAQELTRQ